MTQPDALQRSLAQLLLRQPFLASLALRLERRLDPTADTACTDGIHLAVNPTWFETLSDPLRITLVAHECWHVALGHPLRRAGRDPDRWNRACDYAVNALLHSDGFPLWPGALHDPAFGDASAEAIYNRLPPSPSPSAPSPSPPDSSSPPTPSSSSPPSPPSSPSPPQQPPPPPPPPPSSDPAGDVRDQPTPTPLTPAQHESRLAQHAVLVAALAQQARAAGRDSAANRRAVATAAHTATVDWRALLADFLHAHHHQDHSWRRPDPRYTAFGLYLPRLEPAAPGSIAFVLDTSASIPSDTLALVAVELEAYLLQVPAATLDLLYADAKVTGRATYTAADLPLRLQPKGGGGTDFRPALTLLADADTPPAALVYLTDLEGRFPAEPPPMPVLWLVLDQPLTPPTAPFGRVVVLPF